MKLKIKLVRLGDHYYVSYDGHFKSVEETLPIDDPEMHSRSDFRLFIITNRGENHVVLSDEQKVFLENNFIEDTMFVEKIDKYLIQINCHSDNYINRFKKWKEAEDKKDAAYNRRMASQWEFENLSTMFGGDCE